MEMIKGFVADVRHFLLQPKFISNRASGQCSLVGFQMVMSGSWCEGESRGVWRGYSEELG